MTTADHDVPTSWGRIATWLLTHTRPPVEPVRPAADRARLAAFEEHLGLLLPPDLTAWWLLPGVAQGHWILDEFAAVALDEALETHAIWLLVAEQEVEPVDTRYLPAYMPIGLSPGGDGLIVDLRPGGTHGAVLRRDHETCSLEVPLWPSVAAMLDDLANALETGAPALRHHAALGGSTPPHAAAIDDNRGLTWHPAG
ncbi:SMI1/KNR4 family protein [Kitasatospora sp. NPDC094015]|uniref:SMI1/KNR4 family protein n=1 Tax=Kitasatospora sp. NPDC094015 TaxID=3155205 RepID=UPI00332DCB26